MERCSYCKQEAIGYDALGIPACFDHLMEADAYVAEHTSKPFMGTNGVNRWPIAVPTEEEV